VRATSAFERVKIYNIPDSDSAQEILWNQKQEEAVRKRRLLVDSFKLIYEEISELVALVGQSESSSKLEVDLTFIHRQKGIWETMNKYSVQGGSLVGECWVPQI